MWVYWNKQLDSYNTKDYFRVDFCVVSKRLWKTVDELVVNY